MPYLTVWVHYVWSTKNREPMILRGVKPLLYAHIRENALAKGIRLDTINGTADHVHAVVALKPEQTVAYIAQMLKGESAHWMNEKQLVRGSFQWQDEYFAASVSESGLAGLRTYIANQEEHHRVKTFTEEWQKLMKESTKAQESKPVRLGGG